MEFKWVSANLCLNRHQQEKDKAKMKKDNVHHVWQHYIKSFNKCGPHYSLLTHIKCLAIIGWQLKRTSYGT